MSCADCRNSVRARHARGLAAQAGDDLIGGGFAHADRLELHEHLRGVAAAASAAAAAADDVDRVHIRIGADLLLEPLRLLDKRRERDVLLALHAALQTAGILLREEALGDLDVEVNVHADGQPPSRAS